MDIWRACPLLVLSLTTLTIAPRRLTQCCIHPCSVVRSTAGTLRTRIRAGHSVPLSTISEGLR